MPAPETAVELPRQCGKTTAIVGAVEFLLAASRRYLGRPLRVGIFAPTVEQATTDFDRLKDLLTEVAPLGFRSRAETEYDLRIPEKWNSKTIKLYDASNRFLGEVYIFPLQKQSKLESKTLDLIIIEEAQDVYDRKMKDAVFPMGASTNAPRVYVGTAGTRVCYFKRELDAGEGAVKITLEEVLKERAECAAATGDRRHLLYETFVTSEIRKHGRDSEYVRRQYLGQWIIGSGQFTTAERVRALVVPGLQLVGEYRGGEPVFVGIDTAKKVDRTVATAVRLLADHERPADGTGPRTRLVGWLRLKGVNYIDQCEIIRDWISGNYPSAYLLAIDSTGQGDFMPDWFEREAPWQLKRVAFTAQSKDAMYKNLRQVIENGLTELPDLPPGHDHFDPFLRELCDLECEVRGRFLSVHHPDAQDGGEVLHDDYCDAWSLAEWAVTEYLNTQPRIL